MKQSHFHVKYFSASQSGHEAAPSPLQMEQGPQQMMCLPEFNKEKVGNV